MKRRHPPVLVLSIAVLLIGLSVSGGPFVWAVLAILGPLAIMMIFATAGAAHGSPVVPRAEHLPGADFATPEARRATLLRDRERIAREAASEYARVHHDD